MTYLTSLTSIAPTNPSRASQTSNPPLGIAAKLAWFWRAYQNRRAIGRLMALDAHELRDIGLTRSDVASALSLRLSSDPSTHLAAQLIERRRMDRLNRLCR